MRSARPLAAPASRIGRNLGLHARSVDLLLLGLSVVGFALTAEVLLQHGIFTAGGTGAFDAWGYYLGAVHVREGQPLYGSNVGEIGAYLYPPPVAQALVPFTALPFAAFTWLWRAVQLVALRIAVGSFRNAGLALLVFPPVIGEIDAGNVHLFIAAVVALAIRGRATGVAPAVFLKFASLAALPMGFRSDRRGLAIGALAAAIVAAVSFVLAPSLWRDYASYLTQARLPESGWLDIGAGIPVLLRLGSALVLGLAAARWSRLAPAAVTLCYPVVWVNTLSTLVALAATPAAYEGTRRQPDDALPPLDSV